MMQSIYFCSILLDTAFKRILFNLNYQLKSEKLMQINVTQNNLLLEENVNSNFDLTLLYIKF